MTTPLPLPVRPSCRLTWIEYRPFFMMCRPGRPSPSSGSNFLCQAWHTASTRQVNRRVRTDGAASRDVVQPVSRALASSVFLVALQELNRDALGPANEADAYARPDSDRLFGELDALGLDLGSHRVDVFHRQSEMIEPLIGGHWCRIDTVACRDRGDEHIGAAELDVDAPRAADDLSAENVFKPGSRRLRIGAAQVDVIPGH